MLIEESDLADAKMRIFNRDGSEGMIAGNSIRCVAKYIYDNGLAKGSVVQIETRVGVRELELYTIGGKVRSVRVDMGEVSLDPRSLPAKIAVARAVNYPVTVAGQHTRVTCVSVGNPHCVVFTDRVDGVDLARVGPLFEHDPLFPERVNTEFVRVINPRAIKMRVWERGNGETMACGTGACAAAVAAVENGYCLRDEDITVKLPGGDLIVRYDGTRVWLTGNANVIYEGVLQY